jgi:hypothetical protein
MTMAASSSRQRTRAWATSSAQGRDRRPQLAVRAGQRSSAEFLRLAQVVYTLTQFETIEGVSFRLEGEPVELFGRHGIIVARPQTRQDFKQRVRP